MRARCTLLGRLIRLASYEAGCALYRVVCCCERRPYKGRTRETDPDVHLSKASKMAKGKKGGKKGKKGTSNVFSMFDSTQLAEFKEAFGMMDANRDGFIDGNDLKATYASLGVMKIEHDKIDSMMKEAPAAVNFTVFLNMLAEKMTGTDPEDVILNAFKTLDPEGTGTLPSEVFAGMLTSQADKFSEEEMNGMLKLASIDADGNLDYKAIAHVITHGVDETEGEAAAEEEE